jgi:hypothetical protein
MAAGLGFKDFTTGEVLTAADVDGYLMQGIWVFTNATARDAAVTSPQEGNFAFTKDNNSLWYYDGAAWVSSGATGDIEGVTAGIGISGGGTSGTVTVTNSMATAIDAKGDLVAGTGADTFAKLTVGANDTVLTADSTTATGLKWAAPAGGGGMTLISTTTLSGASVTLSSIPSTYKHLLTVFSNVTADVNFYFVLKPNNASTCDLQSWDMGNTTGTVSSYTASDFFLNTNTALDSGSARNAGNCWIYNYASTTQRKSISSFLGYKAATPTRAALGIGYFDSTSAISSLVFTAGGGSFTGGTLLLYGVS